MKSLDLKEMEAIEGGRFLGWGYKHINEGQVDHHPDCGGGGAKTYSEVYTVFGLEMPSLGYHTNQVRCLR